MQGRMLNSVGEVARFRTSFFHGELSVSQKRDGTNRGKIRANGICVCVYSI